MKFGLFYLALSFQFLSLHAPPSSSFTVDISHQWLTLLRCDCGGRSMDIYNNNLSFFCPDPAKEFLDLTSTDTNSMPCCLAFFLRPRDSGSGQKPPKNALHKSHGESRSDNEEASSGYPSSRQQQQKKMARWSSFVPGLGSLRHGFRSKTAAIVSRYSCETDIGRIAVEFVPQTLWRCDDEAAAVFAPIDSPSHHLHQPSS